MEKMDEEQSILCMACLCVGRSLHKLENDKLKQYYLETLKEIPLCNELSISPVVCWECEALLKKLLSFREQVKDSYRILQTYTHENLYECLLSDVSRPPRLKVFINKPVIISPDDQEEKIKDEVKTELNEGTVTHIDELEDQIRVSISEEVSSEQVLTCPNTKVKKEFRKHRKQKNCSKINSKKSQLPKLPTPTQPSELCLLEEIDDKSAVHLDIKYETKDCKDIPKSIEVEVSIENVEDDISQISNGSDEGTEVEVKNILENKKTKTKRFINSSIKKSTKIIKRLKSVKKIRQPEKSVLNQKILTLELTYDEMLAERDKESQRDSYVKAQYKCETCLIGFNYNKSYKAHLVAKHSPNSGDYSCPICKTITSSVESFTAHYKRHMRRYECSICRKRTVDVKAMQQHYYTTHEISLKEYKCNLCGQISNSIDTHRYHKDTHKARVKCDECDKTFIHRAGLMNHRLSVHEFQNVFPCTVCDKVFRWKTSLKRHLEKHNIKNKATADADAYCAECDIGFSSVCSLQRHLRNSLKHVTHDQLRFICDHCNRRFADKTKLRDHIEEKHLHRTYQCHICQKTSKNRVGLEQHVRNVHKGRPNNKMCHHCGKGFPTKVQLESHIRTHTGERPFICEYCPTTFSQQSNLYKHHRQVHLNIKSKRYPLCNKKKTPEGNQNDKPSQSEYSDQLPLLTGIYSVYYA